MFAPWITAALLRKIYAPEPSRHTHRLDDGFHAVEPSTKWVMVLLHFKVHLLDEQLFDRLVLGIVNAIDHFVWVSHQVIKLAASTGVENQFMCWCAPHSLWKRGKVTILLSEDALTRTERLISKQWQ